jgi:hypothetical protein
MTIRGRDASESANHFGMRRDGLDATPYLEPAGQVSSLRLLFPSMRERARETRRRAGTPRSHGITREAKDGRPVLLSGRGGLAGGNRARSCFAASERSRSSEQLLQGQEARDPKAALSLLVEIIEGAETGRTAR